MNTQQGPKIFFMHIAKTAGTYVNNAFAQAVGHDQCLAHCEQFAGSEESFRHAILNKRFVSGHLYYHHWLRLAGPLAADFLPITFLRNPVEQLVSHILFVDQFNQPKFRSTYEGLLTSEVRELVDQLSAVDFISPDSIADFLESLTPKGVELFNNCQSRYFLAGSESMTPSSALIKSSSSTILTEIIVHMDHIFLTSHLSKGFARLRALTGIPLTASDTKLNVTSCRRSLDTDNPLISAALQRHIVLDNLLYSSVKQRNQ